MSVASFIVGGLGRSGSVALFITEGFYENGGVPPVNAVLGGMVKRRHSKRYEITVNNIPFMARSIPELEAKVLRWRREHPANDKKPVVARRVALPTPKEVESAPLLETPRGPERRENRDASPAVVSRETFPAQQAIAAAAVLAQQEAALEARRAQEEAHRQHLAALEARRLADEEDDLAAITAILKAIAA